MQGSDHIKKCKHCGKKFISNYYNRKFCCRECYLNNQNYLSWRSKFKNSRYIYSSRAERLKVELGIN